jgi:hypothetical protein
VKVAFPIAVILACAIGCTTADPFAHLAKRLSTEEIDGHFTPVELPEAASPAEVAAQNLRGAGEYVVLKVGSVSINGVVSPAVLADTKEHGKRIVLMHFVPQRGWWFTRAFDAD